MRNGIDDLVSVVIPVFNAEKYLPATLDSILKQTYPNVEVVAVDDGSTDASLEILERYPGRIQIIKQRNSGAAVARNRGCKEANGKWIAFLDADDIWVPEKLQKQLALCHQFSWSYTDVKFKGGVNDGKNDSDLNVKFSGNILEPLICNNFIATSTLLIEREFFEASGGFDTSLESIEDWELWIRLAAEYPIKYLNEPLTLYRVHSSSVSRNARKTLPWHIAVIEKAFAKGGPAESLKHMMLEAKANSYSICSHIAEEENDYFFTLQCAIMACKSKPSDIGLWRRAIKSLIKYVIFPRYAVGQR